MTIKTEMDTKEEFYDPQKGDKISSESITFIVVDGEELDFGKTFKFTNEDLIKIGRGNQNDIVLSDQRISTNHCKLMIIRNRNVIEQVIISDLESTNGTFVNTELISKGVLKNGDKIKVGQTVLRFSVNDQVESTYHSRLFKLAIMDTLTGLYNKRYLIQTLENTFKIVKRNKRNLSLIIFDIDDFKSINDNFGHLAGDEYLKILGGVLNNTLREQDICGRYGGEEFFLVLPETGSEGAKKVGEKVRSRIEKLKVFYNNKKINTTISGGIGCFKPEIQTVKDLITIADKALYKAKESGKNRVVDGSF